ncbi:hypothetical protein L596_029545 [Steinernema carpocapsae]|uniref:Uncharacterized protein n=1 Tax=Steinernema carpocapsae TaxID=34508 RepID=A0A4U5LUY8_STECR|nr:hypothetical protein L596_029545 [Steinernema carpocapsae]
MCCLKEIRCLDSETLVALVTGSSGHLKKTNAVIRYSSWRAADVVESGRRSDRRRRASAGSRLARGRRWKAFMVSGCLEHSATFETYEQSKSVLFQTETIVRRSVEASEGAFGKPAVLP